MARRSILGTAVRANIVANAAGRAAHRNAQARAQSPAPAPQAAAPANSSADDVATQLERLAALKASGVLTEEEFAGAKAKLLG